MSESANGSADPVAAAANRLRLVQIDFADQSEQVRRGYLTDEIERALSGIVPGQRQSFLHELQARFPTWDGKVEVQPDAAAGRASFDERELKDPSFLVGRLVDLADSLTDAQRQAVISRLQEAGLVGSGRPDWPQAAATEVRAKLQLAPKDPIDPLRALELLSMLAELVCSLDQVVWSAWRSIAPQTNVKRPAAVQKNMGRFVAADPNVPRGQVAQDVGRLRQLIASLVAPIPQAGRFAVQHFKSLSPDEIKVLVGSSGFGLEGKYWRKYVELAGSVDASVVEDEIRRAIADYAETLMKGR